MVSVLNLEWEKKKKWEQTDCCWAVLNIKPRTFLLLTLPCPRSWEGRDPGQLTQTGQSLLTNDTSYHMLSYGIIEVGELAREATFAWRLDGHQLTGGEQLYILYYHYYFPFIFCPIKLYLKPQFFFLPLPKPLERSEQEKKLCYMIRNEVLGAKR